MRKIYSFILTALLLSTVGVSNAWGETVTIYYAIPSASVGENVTIKLNVHNGTSGEGDKWSESWMTNTSMVYISGTTSYTVFEGSYNNYTGGLARMQLQLFNDGTFQSQMQPIADGNGNDNWTTLSVFQNKMYVHGIDGWSDFFTLYNESTGVHTMFNNSEVTFSLGANTTLQYKVTKNKSVWYGVPDKSNTGMYCNNCSEWQFTTDGGNQVCTLYTTIAGDYTINFDGSNAQVNATYPDTYTRSAGSWGTICLPVAAATLPSNAEFYRIKGLRSATENASEATSKPYSIIIESVDALSAGTPYIFNRTGAGDLSISLNNENYSGDALSANGLVGTYVTTTISANYVILSSGAVQAAGSGCSVPENRAYVDLSGISTTYARSAAITPAPGRRIIEASMDSNTTTVIENVKANEKAVKFFENGQMYILRNGVTYDMTGRAVK